jgi:hypothetical protein
MGKKKGEKSKGNIRPSFSAWEDRKGKKKKGKRDGASIDVRPSVAQQAHGHYCVPSIQHLIFPLFFFFFHIRLHE